MIDCHVKVGTLMAPWESNESLHFLLQLKFDVICQERRITKNDVGCLTHVALRPADFITNVWSWQLLEVEFQMNVRREELGWKEWAYLVVDARAAALAKDEKAGIYCPPKLQIVKKIAREK